MKHINKGMLLFLFFAISLITVSAQNTIKAYVLALDGSPVAEAVVTNESSKEKVIASKKGEFSMNITSGSMLTVTAEGFKDKHVVADNKVQKIFLEKIEMVNVAINTIKKEDLFGDVSYINIPELFEKNYHTYSLDNLQSYIPGFNGSIWGNSSYLVVVDGVPRDASNVMPYEIEQVTVLKGVSAVAIYGSQAVGGAIVITTKRGTAKGDEIRVRANTGINVPKSYPKYLGSAEYMELYNEARTNDGLTPLYNGSTPEYDIANYQSGTNPYRYPDIDYYSSDYLRKVTNHSDIVTEFVGGNDKARYYANLGMSHDNSLLNVGEGKNDATTRMNVRGNIDFKINKFITSKVNATMVFYNSRGAQGNYWSNASTLYPNRYTPLIPLSYLKGQTESEQEALDAIVSNSSFIIDGKYLFGGKNSQQTNPFADMLANGSSTYSSRNFQFDASVNIDMSSFIKGLSFNTQFGIDYLSRFTLSENNNTYAVYDATWWTDENGNEYISKLTKQTNVDKLSRTRSLSGSYLRQNTFLNTGFNYNNTFGDGHNVSALLIARGNMSSISAIYQKDVSTNFALQTSYNYKQKYYADFTGNMVYSTRFAPGKSRRGFSPTLSAGWRISNEEFLQNSDVINDLEITTSAGILNTDINFSEYYLYSEIYSRTGWNSWQEGMARTPTYLTRGGNSDLTFAKRKEFNAGLKAKLFDNKFEFNSNYFYSVMDGLPIQNANLYPSYFSYSSTNMIPYDNYNADLRTGVDFGINYRDRIGEVDLSIGLNGLYYETKALKRSENYEFENQKVQGNPIDAIYGMRAIGIYANEQEIADENLTHALGAVKPGDIKYEDITGDGIIDGKDTEYLGRWSAPVSLGMNITLKWNNFTLFTLFTGNFGGYGVKSNTYNWVYGDRKYSEIVRGRCILGTDETTGDLYVTNMETATYPRLTSLTSDNNFRTSDYWLYKTDRINLSRVQLTYDLPKQLFKTSVINGIGVYLSGSDLLVISKEREYMEMNVGGSPQMRYINLGVKALF